MSRLKPIFLVGLSGMKKDLKVKKTSGLFFYSDLCNKSKKSE